MSPRLQHMKNNERVFDIADLPFAQVPEEEKRLFAGDIKKTGSYRGYKLRNYWVSSLDLVLSPQPL
ncbi:hypothetical protein TRAPUB_4037 [Trametes pubescens]|uniref:Uncharacterized protein n=1 Tax=Trametes pubescens TaxID=154538 RepID=A0A1M2VC88_TRAPU|nr:hypothetical protein TRAPUB_4037 [Trametes pubescens]